MFSSLLGAGIASAGRRRAPGTAPQILGVPTIIGNGRIGEPHSVSGYTVTGNPVPFVTFSWLVDGVEVSTAETYSPVQSDINSTGFSSGFSTGFGATSFLSCKVTATNPAGSDGPEETDSVALSRVTPRLLTAEIEQPTGMRGDTFSVVLSGHEAADAVFYQWLLNGIVVGNSATWLADDAGILTCRVTVTQDDQMFAQTTHPIRIFHQELAGSGGTGAAGASVATASFAADSEISGQVFLVLVCYEGPAPVSATIGGVTLTTFTDGASVTSSGKTLTLIDGDVQSTNKRTYVFALEGLTGAFTGTFQIDTGTNHTYLKEFIYQIAGYNVDNAVVVVPAPASSTSLSVAVIKPIRGIALALANRMPTIAGAPAGWQTAASANNASSPLDFITGYIIGEAAFQGTLTFSQTSPTASQQAVSVALPPLSTGIPEIIGTPTISGGASPVEGVAITLNIASVSTITTHVHVRVYRNTVPLVAVSDVIEYEIGSAVPVPTYVPTASDVGFALVQGQTPTDGIQVGAEVFSAATGIVAAATPGGSDPAVLAANKFTFVGTSEANGGIIVVGGVYVQRADFTVKAGITVPAGWEIALLRSLSPGVTAGSGHTELQNVRTLAQLGVSYNGSADALWRSSGGAAHDQYQYGYAYWRETATGRLIDAVPIDTTINAGYRFQSVIPAALPPPVETFPTADETLGNASSAALISWVNARISGGSTATRILDLPAGQYGILNLSSKILPGKTIIRSSGLNLGAVFTQIIAPLSKNLTFQFIKVTRENSARNATLDVVDFRGSDTCEVEYSEIDCGPNRLRTQVGLTGQGYVHWVMNGIQFDKYDNARRTKDPRAYRNYIHGAAARGVLLGSGTGGYCAENVFADGDGDDIHIADGRTNLQVIDNWGSRIKYVENADGVNAWTHPDFVQINAMFEETSNITIRGNVFMKNIWPSYNLSIPSQGIFAAQAKLRGFTIENNFVLTSARNAIWSDPAPNGYEIGHTIRYNAAIVSANDPYPGQGSIALMSWYGTGTILQRNVSCGPSGYTGAGTEGINIPSGPGNLAGSETYYSQCRSGTSFWEARPIAGKPTHWAYSGIKVGPYQRFYDVIVLGKYPKIGPAATAWKLWYDPRNQITS